MESLFIAAENEPRERTFYRDELLPSLPLPALDDTIKKYLDSCEAVLTPEEFNRTKTIAHQFSAKEGVKLHACLADRAQSKKNWLEEWWFNAYLDYRGPLSGMNFFGGSQLQAWPPEKDSQLERSAIQIYIIMKFWKLLREEKLSPQKDSKGLPFSMCQFRNMLNTSRIPQHGRDRLQKLFKTASEGDSPTHFIVFYRHRIYKMEGIDQQTGEIYTPPHFFKMLSDITSNKQHGAGVAALTELDRDTWCDARSYLMNLTPENRINVTEVDTALMCISLSDIEAKDGSAWMRLGATDSVGDRWADKSFNFIASSNGLFICNSDHTPFDGIVFISFMTYTAAVLNDIKGKWNGSLETELQPEPPKELHFTMDKKLTDLVKKGKDVVAQLKRDFDINLMHCRSFGKKELKALKMHPVAFVQICLQLAYMRKHGKPAPTYETATTRTFYNGRTETVRTCTTETVAFCKAVIHDHPNQRALFKNAYDKYMWLMEECKAGRGCDRHLLGLYSIAEEKGEEIPELFTDPCFAKSGGNGNFVLSTSFTGYGRSIGAVGPMTKDGYGTFYRINNEGISFAITAWNTCDETDSISMGEFIEKALNDVYALMSEQPSKL